MPLHRVSSPLREGDRHAACVQGAPLGRGFTASSPPPHSCAVPLARKARRHRAVPEVCSVWGGVAGSVLSMGHLDPVCVGGSHPVKDPGPGTWGVGNPGRGLLVWCPCPPPHLYPLTLAPILCGGFCYHLHLQDLQGSKLGLSGSFPLGARLPTGGPCALCSPAVDGLPGPVPLWLGSESVRPQGSPWETYKPSNIGHIIQHHLPSDQDASVSICLSVSCKVRWANPKNGAPGQPDSLLLVPPPCERGCFSKKCPLLYEWSRNSHHLDVYQFLFLVTKH